MFCLLGQVSDQSSCSIFLNENMRNKRLVRVIVIVGINGDVVMMMVYGDGY